MTFFSRCAFPELDLENIYQDETPIAAHAVKSNAKRIVGIDLSSATEDFDKSRQENGSCVPQDG